MESGSKAFVLGNNYTRMFMYGAFKLPAMRGTQKIISLCLVQIKDGVLISIKASMPRLFLSVCAPLALSFSLVFYFLSFLSFSAPVHHSIRSLH